MKNHEKYEVFNPLLSARTSSCMHYANASKAKQKQNFQVSFLFIYLCIFKLSLKWRKNSEKEIALQLMYKQYSTV